MSYPNPAYPHDKRDHRFFNWVRRSGLTRGDDRWIGGVGSGLAARLGWNPTLVRALLAGSTLVFGFGLALYGIAWLLMPDARDGRILLEELMSARWDWACVGAFACIIAPVFFLFAGFMVIAAAAVALWALAVSSIRQQKGYGFAYHGGLVNHAAGGFAGGPSGAAYPAAEALGKYGAGTVKPAPGMPGEQSSPEARTGNNTVPGAGFAAAPIYAANVPADPTPSVPAPSQDHGAAMNDSATDNYAASNSAGSPPVGSADSPLWQEGAKMNASDTVELDAVPSLAPSCQRGPRREPTGGEAPVAAAIRPPVQYSQPKPRYARRKPAGPMVVLLTLGVILISAALTMTWLSLNTGFYIEYYLPVATLWTGGVCLVLGIIITILGFRGRRAGGLNPITWVAAIMAVSVLWANVGYSYLLHRADALDEGYSTVWLYGVYREGAATDDTSAGLMALRGTDSKQKDADNDDTGTLNYFVADASPKNMTRLERGVRFNGSNGDSYNETRANIDLTAYGNWHGDWPDACPKGQINVAVDQTRLFVTLPDGCPFSLGKQEQGYHDVARQIGGRNSVVLNNGYTALSLDGNYEYTGWFYDDPNWDWVQDVYEGKIEDKDMLLINIAYIVEGRVTIQYASESKIPSYAQFAEKSQQDYEKFGADYKPLSKKAQHHAAVARGEEKTTEEDWVNGK